MLIILILMVMLNITLIVLYILEKQHKTIVEVEKKPKLTREEKEKQEHIKKSFENLMSYDERIAQKKR